MTRSFRISAAATALVLVALATGFQATAQTFEEGMRAYRSGDYDTAYRAFRGLAEQGDRRAQGSLGDMYRKGYGVAQQETSDGSSSTHSLPVLVAFGSQTVVNDENLEVPIIWGTDPRSDRIRRFRPHVSKLSQAFRLNFVLLRSSA